MMHHWTIGLIPSQHKINHKLKEGSWIKEKGKGSERSARRHSHLRIEMDPNPLCFTKDKRSQKHSGDNLCSAWKPDPAKRLKRMHQTQNDTLGCVPGQGDSFACCNIRHWPNTFLWALTIRKALYAPLFTDDSSRKYRKYKFSLSPFPAEYFLKNPSIDD